MSKHRKWYLNGVEVSRTSYRSRRQVAVPVRPKPTEPPPQPKTKQNMVAKSPAMYDGRVRYDGRWWVDEYGIVHLIDPIKGY
jgi:hypothetical protein